MKTLLKPGQEFDLHIKREYSLFQDLSILKRHVEMIKLVTNKQTVTRFEGKGIWATWYVIRSHMDDCLQHYVRLIEARKAFFDEEMEELEKTGRSMISGAKLVAVKAQKPHADLQSLLLEFWNVFDAHVLSLWKTFMIPEAGAAVFTKLLSQYVPTELHPETIAKYSYPSKKAHLLRLSEELAKKQTVEQRLEYVRKHYPWIFMTDIFSPLPTDEQYAEYARTFEVRKHEDPGLKEFFPKDVMPIVSLCQDILYMKDYRDEFRRQAFFYVQPLVEAIEKRLDISRKDLWFIMPEELNLLETNREKIMHDIEERKESFLLEMDGRDTLFIQGTAAEKEFVVEKDVSQSKVVKGISGSPGRATGTVN